MFLIHVPIAILNKHYNDNIYILINGNTHDAYAFITYVTRSDLQNILVYL